jgi:hypothetical protein
MMKLPLLALASLLWFLSLVPPTFAQDASELDRLRAENAQLRTEIEQLRAELAHLRAANEDLRIEKEQLTELAGVTAEGQQIESAEALIQSQYDAAVNQTVVRTATTPLNMTAGTHADHYMSLLYSFEGQTMSAPPASITMHLQSLHTGGQYRDQPQITFIIDGQSVPTAVSDYRATRKQINRAGKSRSSRDDETLTITIDAELLRKLARATVVEGRLGQATFLLSSNQVATFKAVRKRIELGL